MKYKEFTKKYEVVKTIRIIEIESGFCAYQREVRVDGKDSVIEEGIAKQNESTDLDEMLNSTNYRLFNKGILEYNRNNDNDLFTDDSVYFEITEKYIINKPYSYLMKHGLKDEALINVSHNDEHLFDTENNKYPKMVSFNQYAGGVTNQFYNLEKALEILKGRQDVRLVDDGITDLPRFSISKDKTHYLRFDWMPTDADWMKYRNKPLQASVKSDIADNVLGLIEARLNREERLY